MSAAVRPSAHTVIKQSAHLIARLRAARGLGTRLAEAR